MDAELQRVNQEIASTNQLLLAARRKLKADPNNTDAQADVEHYEKELTRLETRYKTLVTALAPATAPTHLHTVSDNNFLFLGRIKQAKRTKGVRATLYRFANYCFGYHDGENEAFWYDGDDLMIRLLFKSEQNAESFHSRLYEESFSHNSAISASAITDVSLTRTANLVGKKVLPTDYNPDDFDSPQDFVSLESGATSIVDSSRPLFKFQRIESESVFGQHYKANSCHLIDRAYYAKSSEEEEDVENNRLALSSDVHNWFDGKNVDVPLFKITISKDHLISRRPVFENRYEVQLLITALDTDSARLLFPRLKEGSTFYEDRKLEALVKVFVLDPQEFAKCVEWKALKTQKEWDYYYKI